MPPKLTLCFGLLEPNKLIRVNGISKKVKWLLIAGAAAAAIALFTIMGLSEKAALQRQLEGARATARTAGVPLDAQEFRAKLPPENSSKNAWTVYADLIRSYAPAIVDEGVGDGEGDLQLRNLIQTISDAIQYWRRGNRNWDYALSHGDLEVQVEPIVERIDEALALGAFRPEKEWERGHLLEIRELPEFGKFSQILVYDGLRAAYRNDFDRAERRLRGIVALAVQLWQIPLGAYQLSGMNVARNGMALVRTLISVQQIPYPEAKRLFEALEPILRLPDLKANFHSLVFNGLATLNLLNAPDWIKKAELDARIVRRNPPRPELRTQIELEFLQAANRILARWPSDPEDLSAIREALGEDDAKMNLSLGLFSRFMRQTVGTNPDEGLFERTLLPYESHQARIRLMKVLRAALAERERTGALPVELPTTGKDAIDPLSGSALKYALDDLGRAFRAYSVGIDREDNGGMRPQGNGGLGDIVMQYPDDRRTGF